MREAEVIISTAGGEMDCFTCHPEEGGPFPAIVLYMDAPGIREELRDMVRRLATVGYYVILPNMYYRIGREGHYGFDLAQIRNDPTQLQKMFGAMNSLNNAMVVEDTSAMVPWLREQEAVAEGPMGCVGYCMSGRYVVSVGAAFPDDFAAIASYYGVGIITDRPDSPHLKADQVKGEMYLAFAETDSYVPDEVLEQLPGVLDSTGADYRIEIYPGTGHGFAFPKRDDYVKAAGERHWERMFALYDRKLRGR
ncbi:MAG: dienelactone hydrolase family protein [Pseudomonadota bacterium]